MIAGEADEALRFAARVSADPARSVSRWKVLTGGKAVGCLPFGVPEEVAEAAGMLPVTIWGDEYPAAGGILEAIREGRWGSLDAWAVPPSGGCLRAGAEALRSAVAPRPLFLFADPCAGDPQGVLAGLLDLVEAFIEWAGGVSGQTVREGDLEKAIRFHNENRRLLCRIEERMAESPGYLSGTEYLELIGAGMTLPKGAHSQILRQVLGRKSGSARRTGAKVFLAGRMAPLSVMREMEGAGAAVVGNDLSRGRRYSARWASEEGDLALSLARRHLEEGLSPDLCRVDPKPCKELIHRAKECGADRILYLRSRDPDPEDEDVSGLPEAARRGGFHFLVLEIDPMRWMDPTHAERIRSFVD